MKDSRNWCFTLHDYTPEDEERIKNVPCKYMVFGHEVCPTTKRIHLQGYVEFPSVKKFKQVKRLLGDAVHLEFRYGTSKQASDYCKKEDTANFFETGELSKSADGSDEKKKWEAARKAASEHRFDDIPDDIYIRYVKNLEYIASKFPKPMLPTIQGEMEHEWICGVSGAGKDTVFEYENKTWYEKDAQHRWWDDYAGEEVVRVKDFGPQSRWLGEDLKLWADRGQCRVPYKGGYKLIRPRKVVVTSQYLLEGLWSDPETLAALKRRFKIRYFRKPIPYQEIQAGNYREEKDLNQPNFHNLIQGKDGVS